MSSYALHKITTPSK